MYKSSLRSLKVSGALRSSVNGRLTAQASTVSRQSGSRPLALVSQRLFSSSPKAFGSGESDTALIQILKEEIKIEQEQEQTAGEPGNTLEQLVANLQSRADWKIKDTLGSDEVVMTREFGKESIKVVFSLAEYEAFSPSLQEDEWNIDGEKDSEVPEAPEDSEPFMRTYITITKPGAGGIVVDATAQATGFNVSNVTYYPDETVVLDSTSTGDWKRRDWYVGPIFGELEPQLQENFEQYLEERGIDGSLAAFVPEYIELKEQKEYFWWLKGMSKFVQA